MQQQPSSLSASLQLNSQPLCRAVFDELMDKDLLGVLLSAKHFRTFLLNVKVEAPDHIASLAQAVGESVEQACRLQMDILKMYSGVYIAEARCKSEAELHQALDAKLQDSLAPSSRDDAGDDAQSIEVELAWRYRRTCSFGSPIAF